MAIGKPGARNAAWFAASILALSDEALAAGLQAGRSGLAEGVLRDDEAARRTA
jgi:phosphoribosylcarboxyaminoimidazole (NCAIR) mutase